MGGGPSTEGHSCLLIIYLLFMSGRGQHHRGEVKENSLVPTLTATRVSTSLLSLPASFKLNYHLINYINNLGFPKFCLAKLPN